MSTVEVSAHGSVAAPRAAVFERLSDLDAHRTLATPHIEILALHGPRGARTGGHVRLNGPLGVRRTARTRVRAAEFPRRLAGTVDAGRGTRATLTWDLEPDGPHTRVAVALAVRAACVRDRLLLAAGGRRWLERRLALAIERLDATAAPSRSRP